MERALIISRAVSITEEMVAEARARGELHGLDGVFLNYFVERELAMTVAGAVMRRRRHALRELATQPA